MKVLRLIINQNSANYRREEVILNRMTYPLPPFSTIIGALHNACNYREYHDMQISIQGKFESLNNEIYTDNCFLNRLEDDRGMLVKMKNEKLLCGGYEKVAKAKKQGSSFFDRYEIEIFNDDLLTEYKNLKELADKIKQYKKVEYKERLKEYKDQKTSLTKLKKTFDKKSEDFKIIDNKIKQVKLEEDTFKRNVDNYEKVNCLDKLSKFKSLTTSIRNSEELSNIKLIVHIKSDENTIKDIEENIYNLKCIGRAEDFVEIVDCKVVELIEEDDCEINSNYFSYLNFKDIKDECIYFNNIEPGIDQSGTIYYIDKDYKIIDSKRVFNKVKVLYASDYFIDKTSENVLLDKNEDETYIVNFL